MIDEAPNKRAACRVAGIHPSTYYRWRNKQAGGNPLKGLSVADRMLAQQIVAKALAFPTLGPRPVADMLSDEGLAVSASRVWRTLSKHRLNTSALRFELLKAHRRDPAGFVEVSGASSPIRWSSRCRYPRRPYPVGLFPCWLVQRDPPQTRQNPERTDMAIHRELSGVARLRGWSACTNVVFRWDISSTERGSCLSGAQPEGGGTSFLKRSFASSNLGERTDPVDQWVLPWKAKRPVEVSRQSEDGGGWRSNSLATCNTVTAATLRLARLLCPNPLRPRWRSATSPVRTGEDPQRTALRRATQREQQRLGSEQDCCVNSCLELAWSPYVGPPSESRASGGGV